MTDAFSWLELYQKADGAASAILPFPATTRMRREDMHLDNAGKFHLKFTVADSVVPNVNSLGAMPVIQMISLCSTAADNPSQVSARRTAYHAT